MLPKPVADAGRPKALVLPKPPVAGVDVELPKATPIELVRLGILDGQASQDLPVVPNPPEAEGAPNEPNPPEVPAVGAPKGDCC